MIHFVVYFSDQNIFHFDLKIESTDGVDALGKYLNDIFIM